MSKINTKKTLIACSLLFSLLLLQFNPARALDTGVISGKVIPAGAAIQIRVLLASDESEVATTTTNPADGTYTLTGLPLDTDLIVVASDENPDGDGFIANYFNQTLYSDWAETITLTDASPTRGDVDFTLTDGFWVGTEQFTFNVRDGKLLEDLDLRKAIAYGTNREAIRDDAFGTHGEAGVLVHSMIDPTEWYYADPLSLIVYDFDQTEAQTLLTAAGWTDTDSDGIRENAGGEDLSLTFVTTNTPKRILAADLFKAQMLAIGINIVVATYSGGDFFSTDPAVSPLASGNFDIAEFAWGESRGYDVLPNTYYTGNSNNHGGYADTTLDGYYDAAQVGKVSGDLTAFANNALLYQQYFAATLPAFPLFTRLLKPTIGEISGTVYDTNGNPITGTAIQIRALYPIDGSEAASTTANPADGTFTLTGLPIDTDLVAVASDENPDTDGYFPKFYNQTLTLDWAEIITLSNGTPAQGDVDFTLTDGSGATLEQLTFNVRDGKLLEDVNLRKAIAYGTNRQALIDNAWVPNGEGGALVHAMIDPNEWYYANAADLTVYNYNTTTARNILTSAGWTDTDSDGIRENVSNEDLSLTFITTTAPARVASANLFKTQMLAIGIDITVLTYPSGDFFNTDPGLSPLASGSFDIAEFAWGLYLGYDTLPDMYYTGNAAWNFGGHSDAVLDGYYDAARLGKVNEDPTVFEANALLYQQHFADTLPAFPLFARVPILTLTPELKSVGANDGWILESTETSTAGGTMNNTATTLMLGDDAQDRQYRAILHFDTSSLPDNAVVTSATLQLRKQSTSGTNPFTILGSLRVDTRKPDFGLPTLELTDFKASAAKNNIATFNPTPVGPWYSAVFNSTGRLYINRTGTTQFKIYFTIGDNDDLGADLIKFYSGNAGASSRPKLVIQYYVP